MGYFLSGRGAEKNIYCLIKLNGLYSPLPKSVYRKRVQQHEMIKHQIQALWTQRATIPILGFNAVYGTKYHHCTRKTHACFSCVCLYECACVFLGRRRRHQQPGGGAGGDHVLVGGVGQVDSLHAHLRRWRDDAGEALPQTEVSQCSCKRRRNVPSGHCNFVNIWVFADSCVVHNKAFFFKRVWMYKKMETFKSKEMLKVGEFTEESV